MGELVLAGPGFEGWGEAGLGIWLGEGVRAELNTEGCRQDVGLGDLLRGGLDVGGEGGASVWVGFGEKIDVSVGVAVWEVVGGWVRATWVRVGEGIGVGAGLGPDNGDAVGGVLDALTRAPCGGGVETATAGDGSEELRDDLGPNV